MGCLKWGIFLFEKGYFDILRRKPIFDSKLDNLIEIYLILTQVTYKYYIVLYSLRLSNNIFHDLIKSLHCYIQNKYIVLVILY